MFGLKQEVIDGIAQVLRGFPDIEEAIIYGSRAKETHKAGSDIDLTLKGSQLTLETLNKVRSQIDDLLLIYTFDLSLYRQIDNPDLLDHIQRVGKVIYKKH